MNIEFNKDTFFIGAATSACQIEGGYDKDGRTPSIWDVAPKKKVANGDNCHHACEHYSHYKEDVALMKKIGLNSYRFSISFSRVMSEPHKVNEKGIEFYDNLINELIKNNIEPIVTLYHWDLPIYLQKIGGFKNPEIIEYFKEYTKLIVDKFSDRVKYWIPFNEPQCFILIGHVTGVHAPYTFDFFSLNKITKHFLIANNEMIRIIRENARIKPVVGISMATVVSIPKDNSEKAYKKAYKKTFFSMMGKLSNFFFNDPVFLKKKSRMLGIFSQSKKTLAKLDQDVDFIGINAYQPLTNTSIEIKASKKEKEQKHTSMGWIIDGKCLYYSAKFFYDRYKKPIIITENGVAFNDVVNNGAVHDQNRIEYIEEYFSNLMKAKREGVDIRGYLYWSLLDNFEWAWGYEPRFGLIYVDFNSYERIVKDSGIKFTEIIQKYLQQNND